MSTSILENYFIKNSSFRIRGPSFFLPTVSNMLFCRDKYGFMYFEPKSYHISRFLRFLALLLAFLAVKEMNFSGGH